jgi:hypothetical protein
MHTGPPACAAPVQSKCVAVAAAIGFPLALWLADGSLRAAFGAVALVAGTGRVAHRLRR